MTIIPTTPDHYQVFFQAAFKPRVAILTQYTGEMRHVKNRVYEAYAIAMVNTSELPPDPGADSTSPQVWAVRTRGEITDCDTFDFEIDFFVVYQWRDDLIPFLDAPDSSRLAPGATIHERYRRMNATVCTSCPVRADDPSPVVPERFVLAPGRDARSRQ